MEPLSAVKFDGATYSWAERKGSPELLFQMRRRVCRVRRESVELAEGSSAGMETGTLIAYCEEPAEGLKANVLLEPNGPSPDVHLLVVRIAGKDGEAIELDLHF